MGTPPGNIIEASERYSFTESLKRLLLILCSNCLILFTYDAVRNDLLISIKSELFKSEDDAYYIPCVPDLILYEQLCSKIPINFSYTLTKQYSKHSYRDVETSTTSLKHTTIGDTEVSMEPFPFVAKPSILSKIEDEISQRGEFVLDVPKFVDILFKLGAIKPKED